MVLLLLVTSTIYFATGNPGDGLFLAAAILLVAAISLYQESRSRNALKALRALTQAKCKAIREGETIEIDNEDIVRGDLLVLEEGGTVPADGRILQANDFSLNESILTGESLSLSKNEQEGQNEVFRGTLVAGGLAIVEVTAVGSATRLGQIGAQMEDIDREKSPLERQIASFVQKMVLLGAGIFVLIWGIHFFRSGDALDALLKALTLAMSILPEEIPVAYATFMAMGAWRLMKMGVLVKQVKTVEALGSATVICSDKTGTITQNKMSLARLYPVHADQPRKPDGQLSAGERELLAMAMWSSEPIPFDPMEIALHEAYAQHFTEDERPSFHMVHEYPLSGKPPMMTHIFENGAGRRIVAAKGAPEALFEVSELGVEERGQMEKALLDLAEEGFRVLAVGEALAPDRAFPAKQQEYRFRLLGLVAFYDPPKENIPEVLQDFYTAGLQVKIITGDNARTTGAIARQIGFRHADASISGDELMEIEDGALEDAVEGKSIFTRMFPEAKLRIIEALKRRGEIVAMTGDGVNDGPALKAAYIGIAMGQKGSEIAKQSASLVLVEDDLSKMVDAIAMGRKIYSNLKKAIRYIISIHIPIILTVFLPLALGWIYPDILSPVHVILLELIMGPTCSIVYENEPMEGNLMEEPPRSAGSSFFKGRELATSILQGLVISAGVLGTYQIAVFQGFGEGVTRAMVFTALISANIFLTFVNRSFIHSIWRSFRYPNRLVPFMVGLTALIGAALLFVPVFASFFGFSLLGWSQLLTGIGMGAASALWFELVKWAKRLRMR